MRVRALAAAFFIFAGVPATSFASLIAVGDQNQLDRLKSEHRYSDLRDRLAALKARLIKAKKLPRSYETFTVNLITRQDAVEIGQDKTMTSYLMREIGDLYLELGDPEKSGDAYQAGLDALPDTPLEAQLRNGLACATIERDDTKTASYRSALAAFNKSARLEHSFKDIKVQALHGVCYTGWRLWVFDGHKDDKAWKAAETACDTALRWSPPAEVQADIHVTLASLYADSKDPDHAQEQLGKAVEADPRNVWAHTVLARGYLRAGDLKKAKKEYKILAKLDRKHADAVRKWIKRKTGK